MKDIRRIKPEEFKTAFLKIVSDQGKRLVDLWNSKKEKGQKETEYTLYFVGRNPNPSQDSFLGRVAQELNLHYCKEYWSLDAIFFESKDEKHFPSNSFYVNNISIALEHEYDAKNAVGEVNKLTIINAPLRVLITYPKEDKINSHLKEYIEIIRDADVFDDFSTQRKFMVVFGPVEKPQKIDCWKFFIYDNGNFKEIRNSR